MQNRSSGVPPRRFEAGERGEIDAYPLPAARCLPYKPSWSPLILGW